jgi:hypothetical protein
MLPIVDFPTIVQDALTAVGHVCDTDAARRHFAEYLTGLMVAERTTVSGINRALAVTADQSCLPRWRTEVEWDVPTLHAQRWAWLQQAPQTRDSVRGVLASDQTLVHHEGTLLEGVGWFWEHADQRHGIAHDDLMAHSVCTSGAHDPIEGRRVKKRTAWRAEECQDHTALCLELLDAAVQRGIPGDLPLDSSCTSATVLNHIQRTPRASVGDLQLNRNVV